MWVLVTFRGFLLVLSTLNQVFQELKLHMTLMLESHTSIKNYWPNAIQIWIPFVMNKCDSAAWEWVESELIALLDCFAALIKMQGYHFIHSLLQLKWLVCYVNLLQIAADVKLSMWYYSLVTIKWIGLDISSYLQTVIDVKMVIARKNPHDGLFFLITTKLNGLLD